MCKFCEPSVFGNGMELNKEIMRKSVGVGNCQELFTMEVWTWSNEDGSNPSIQFILDSYNAGDIAKIDISIKYCPMCGRKIDAGKLIEEN